jgi:hypothetical protein
VGEHRRREAGRCRAEVAGGAGDLVGRRLRGGAVGRAGLQLRARGPGADSDAGGAIPSSRDGGEVGGQLLIKGRYEGGKVAVSTSCAAWAAAACCAVRCRTPGCSGSCESAGSRRVTASETAALMIAKSRWGGCGRLSAGVCTGTQGCGSIPRQRLPDAFGITVSAVAEVAVRYVAADGGGRGHAAARRVRGFKLGMGFHLSRSLVHCGESADVLLLGRPGLRMAISEGSGRGNKKNRVSSCLRRWSRA